MKMLKTVWHHKKLDIVVKASYTLDTWKVRLRQIKANGDEVISVEAVTIPDLLSKLDIGHYA